MNMCTVQNIKDAIRESYQSQFNMESTDIDWFYRPSRFRSMISHSASRQSASAPTGAGRTRRTANSHNLS